MFWFQAVVFRALNTKPNHDQFGSCDALFRQPRLLLKSGSLNSYLENLLIISFYSTAGGRGSKQCHYLCRCLWPSSEFFNISIVKLRFLINQELWVFFFSVGRLHSLEFELIHKSYYEFSNLRVKKSTINQVCMQMIIKSGLHYQYRWFDAWKFLYRVFFRSFHSKIVNWQCCKLFPRRQCFIHSSFFVWFFTVAVQHSLHQWTDTDPIPCR